MSFEPEFWGVLNEGERGTRVKMTIVSKNGVKLIKFGGASIARY